MSVPIQSQAFNPISGVFGNGNVRIFPSSGTWSVPPGVANVRARCFGGGGGAGAGGGGFTMLAIYGLSGVTSVAVTVGAGGAATFSGGTSSFGSYCSATGGTWLSGTGAGGTGVGGDINNTGGAGFSAQGSGGVASLFGNGGNGPAGGGGGAGLSGASGGGSGSTVNNNGGNGIFGSGGSTANATTLPSVQPTSNMPSFSIDFIGTGGGGSYLQPGINGGGGGYNAGGGYPGGGGGGSTNGTGASGMVIVEW